MTLEFKDPGKMLPGNANFDWAEIAQELRENPGSWAVLDAENRKKNKDASHEIARRIRMGTIMSMKARRNEFEAVTRGAELYARYVGRRGEYR